MFYSVFLGIIAIMAIMGIIAMAMGRGVRWALASGRTHGRPDSPSPVYGGHMGVIFEVDLKSRLM